MEIKTFEDLIHWVRDMHGFLSRSLRESAGHHDNEQARALLGYLSDHEQELVRITEEFERQADPRALSTRLYDYLKRRPVKVSDPADTHFVSLGFDEICEEIFRFHDQVIELYDSLAGKAEIAAVRELMESLREMEEHEAMRLARQVASSRDL